MSNETVPVGVYWDRHTWDRARAAYVADLDTDPDCPDAFIGWLHRALQRHIARTSRQRAAAAKDLQPPAGGQGVSKMHPLPIQLVDALEQAIVDDRQRSGRMVSRSGFVRESAQQAATEAEQRLGKALLPPPGRLPNRPPRRAPQHWLLR